MDTTGYIALTRQTGLLKELQAVANNIANISTTGFRREGVIFAEELMALDAEGGGVAMTSARVRFTDGNTGSTSKTGGDFDLAIDGPGFLWSKHLRVTVLHARAVLAPMQTGIWYR